jgi:hypothetical protein
VEHLTETVGIGQKNIWCTLLDPAPANCCEAIAVGARSIRRSCAGGIFDAWPQDTLTTQIPSRIIENRCKLLRWAPPGVDPFRAAVDLLEVSDNYCREPNVVAIVGVTLIRARVSKTVDDGGGGVFYVHGDLFLRGNR